MSKIKVNVSYSETSNRLFYQNFEIVDKLPAVGDEYGHGRVEEIIKVSPDPSNRDEVHDYDYFTLTVSHKEDPDYDEEDRDELTEEHIAISVNKPNHSEAVLFLACLPPTIVEADLILRAWFESGQNTNGYLYGVIKDVIDVDLAGDDEEKEEFLSHLFEELFGISAELYEACVIDNCIELANSQYDKMWRSPKQGTHTQFAQTTYAISSDGFGIMVFAKVPYWVDDRYNTIITDNDISPWLDRLPKRTFGDLHPRVYSSLLEMVGEKTVHREGGSVCIESYPSFFDLVSLNTDELVNMAVLLDDVLHAPFRKLLKLCKLTRMELSERFCIPVSTVSEWFYNNGARPYIRLMLAEACGLIDRKSCGLDAKKGRSENDEE